MKLLSIILILGVSSVMVHSAAVHEDPIGSFLEHIYEKTINHCENDNSDVSDVKDCVGSSIKKSSEDIYHICYPFIEKCECLDCIRENLRLAFFDLFILSTVVEPCEWFEHKADESYDDIAKCMDEEFSGKNFNKFWKIDADSEWAAIKQVALDCKDGDDAKKGQEIVECTIANYHNERVKEHECESNANRNLKLFRSLKDLLSRYQN